MNEELLIKISADISEIKKNLQNAQKQVGDFDKKSSKALKAVGTAFKATGKVIGTAMKAVGAALIAGAAAVVGLSESTREYRQEQAKLVTAFEAAGASADTAKETYNDLYRVLGDSAQATEAANHLAQLTTNQQELGEWTNICQGVYATFGDSLPIESLTEAANETAKTGEVTGALADALNWAGISEEDFNAQLLACNDEAEREKLIRETLNGVYDEAAQGYEKNAESILASNEATAALTAALADLGATVEPIVTLLKEGLAGGLTAITPALTMVADGLKDILNGVDGGAEKMTEGISNLFETLLSKITQSLPMIVSIGVDIITALIDGLLGQLPAIISALTDIIAEIVNALPTIIQAIVDALPSIIESLMESLVELIPVLITGITDIFVILAKNFSKIITPIIDALPDIIIAIVEALVENLPDIIDGLIALILGIVDAAPKIIQGLIDALPTVISLLIQALLNNLPKIIAGLIKVVFGVVKSLPQIFKSLISGVVNVLKGIWDGLGKVFGNVGNWFKEKFSGAANGIKNAFASIGSFFSGIWNKIKSIFSKVGSTIGNAVSSAFKNAINWVLSKAIGLINGFIGMINGAIGIINKIPGVNISKINKLDVPKLAQGGVVDSATVAMIGENGKEAVVPLENNLGWLDKLADMLSDRMGGGGPVILQVDKRVLGQVTVEGINNITRLKGSNPLILA